MYKDIVLLPVVPEYFRVLSRKRIVFLISNLRMVHKVHDPRIYLWLVLSSEQHSARKIFISFQWPITAFFVTLKL